MAIEYRDKVLLGCAGLLALGLVSGGYLLGDGLKRAHLANRAVTDGGKTSSRYSCGCSSNNSQQGIETTRAGTPSASSFLSLAATICGVSMPQRIRETLEWATYPMPDAFWTELAVLPVDTKDPEATRVYRPG